MSEKLANLGYLTIGKETTRGTAVVPTVAVPLYSESLFTNQNLDLDNPIVGKRAGIFQILQGQRDHQGELSVLCEPKTLPHFLQMFLDKSGSAGSGVYTHSFIEGEAEAAYTFDILKGEVVHRYFGVEVRSISPEFDDNKMKLSLNVSALGHVGIVPISSGASSTINLATDYDPEPAKGLVAGDVITLVDVSGGTVDGTENATIQSINAAKTILTLAAPISNTYAAGDYLYIRSTTTALAIGTPFTWARAEFRFGDTAAAALTASQTRVERGSKFDIVHEFENDEGAKRSGSFDPASLPRKQINADITIKRFLDTNGMELQNWMKRTKRSLVIRLFSSLISGSDYNEFRITLNNLKIVESPDPLTSGEIIYLNQMLKAQYDSSDSQMLDIKVVNDVASY